MFSRQYRRDTEQVTKRDALGPGSSLVDKVRETRAGAADAVKKARLRKKFPTIEDLRRRTRSRVPRFAFDFVDCGVNDDLGVRRNRAAFDAIEIVPRYCVDLAGLSTEVELFGRRYSVPIGVSPMGAGSVMWPKAEQLIAREAQRRNIPYVLSTPASASIEEIAEIAGDVFWFQLYRFKENDNAITYDLVRRAEAAGAQVLVPTIDSAGKSKRPRDIRWGVKMPFRVTPTIAAQCAVAPLWSLGHLRHGQPRTENLVPYVKGPATRDSTGQMMRVRADGSHTFEELARLRDRWKRPFVVKGVMHPADAERLVQIGVDGMVVSNHGGRHFDAAPASIDVLPSIVATVGSRAVVMVDSGVRGGLDILRAFALGAKFTFAGRPFLFSVGALGEDGPDHLIDIYRDELRVELEHAGILSPLEAPSLTVRHPGAWNILAPSGSAEPKKEGARLIGFSGVKN
jgi:L-lactate dehydrogenase (cytochrome)